MPKGDDALARKKNKAMRKKMNSDPSKVSNRIAAIIAQKKRRQSGKRRMCQGMCFSLPTPENPFNDREMKLDSEKKDKKKESKKSRPTKGDKILSEDGNGATLKKRKANTGHANQEAKKLRVEKGQKQLPTSTSSQEPKSKIKLGNGHMSEDEGCPSKFLISCLKTIQEAVQLDEAFGIEQSKPLFYDAWGFEFWKCYSSGRNVLETSGACSAMEQIAWIASTAVDTIARKEKEGLSFTSPFLLFLVPSQQKAAKVRSVCKPLKALGIHTVSLHPGASLDHQIHGLKTCEPEFLVCTPDRLLELISMDAVDVSGICSLVVDGVESSSAAVYLDNVKSIRQRISGDPHTLVFSSGLSDATLPALQSLLPCPVYRLSRDDGIANQSACIIQSIDVVGSAEEKVKKGLQLLDEVSGDQLVPGPSRVMFIVGKESSLEELVSSIKSKGYSIMMNAVSGGPEVVNSDNEPTVSMINVEEIDEADLSDFEVVIIYNFALGIEDYKAILTGMARYTIKGKLHALLIREDASVAAPLIEILEQCGQEVPETLKQLCTFTTASLLQR